MLFIRRVKIRAHERGLLFRDQELVRRLLPGRHWIFDPSLTVRIDRLSVRQPFVTHPELEVVVKSGVLGDEAEVLDVGDHQRALVWIDGRFARLLGPGLHAVWTVFQAVRSEVVEVGSGRLEHPELVAILNGAGTAAHLEMVTVEAGRVGLHVRGGRLEGELAPGLHALWRGSAPQRVVQVDLREQTLDVAGQEIMTADKVSLRMNAVVTYRVVDAAKAVRTVEDFSQALYREAQLALRAVVGTRELDALLGDKDAVAAELDRSVKVRAATFGVEVLAFGIRDLILPGEMRTLMNRVTEARKAAEANLIARREETAAMRSQANTARILESSPTLMKLRELEVLEKVAGSAQLSVVLTETGLGDRVLKMI